MLDPEVAAATGQPNVDTDSVISVTPDETDPSWSQVQFADGRTETRPTAEADALPKAAPEGPPPPPVGAGVAYDQLSGNPLASPAAAPLPPPLVTGSVAPGAAAPTEAGLVDTAKAGGAPPMAGKVLDLGVKLTPGDGPGKLPERQVDPGSTLLAPAGGAGAAPGDVQTTTGRTEEEYAVDPAQAAANAQAGYQQLEQDVVETEANELAARRAQTDAAEQAAQGQISKQYEAIRKAEIFTEESRRALKAVEDHPIEEDFYKDSPGRQVAAWVALALSGFLTGSTKGANPALGQMMKALSDAQERFVANQRADKNSKLSLRARDLEDAKTAEASVRMQMPGLIEKHAQLAAQKAGLSELVPGVSTAVAQIRMKSMEAQQQFAQHPVARTERRLVEERKGGARGPVFQGDVELQAIGVDPKAHNQAMDPKGDNLGGLVQGAHRLQAIHNELQAIAARHGGELPHQNLVSYDTFGAAKMATRLGSKDAADQVRARQLLEEAKLAFKQTINIKSVDSENEGKNFNAMIDSGTTDQTLQALAERVQETNQRAVSTASGYSRAPQAYLEFVQRTLRTNPGVTGAGAPPTPKRSTGFKVDAPAAPAEPAPAPSPGGSAEAPKASDPRPAPTGSRRGTYQRLRESKPNEPR